MVAIPYRTPVNYVGKAFSLIGDIAQGMVIGFGVWIAVTSLWLHAPFELDTNNLLANFDINAVPYVVDAVAFMIYVNRNDKPLIRCAAWGLFYGGQSVVLVSIFRFAGGDSSSKHIDAPLDHILLTCIALSYPLGLIGAFIEHWVTRWIERRGAAFAQSLGFWSWWEFWQWAASVVTCALLISIACEEPIGKIAVSIIAAFILGSFIKEWHDYRRSRQKSAELVFSIIALKIGGTITALVALPLLLGDYLTQAPLTAIIATRGPQLAAIFCAFAIPTFLLAYDRIKEQRLLAFCHAASAFWGMGAVCGAITAIALAIGFDYKTGTHDGTYAETAAVWMGFAFCLVALLANFKISQLVFGILTGAYAAVEVVKVTASVVVAVVIGAVFPVGILASSRTDLHPFHPATWEDRLYLGIFIGCLWLIVLAVLEYYASVLLIADDVTRAFGGKKSPPGGPRKPFSGEHD